MWFSALTDSDRVSSGLASCSSRCNELDSRALAGMTFLSPANSGVFAVGGWAWHDLCADESPVALVLGESGHASIIRRLLRSAVDVNVLSLPCSDHELLGARHLWGNAELLAPSCGTSAALAYLRSWSHSAWEPTCVAFVEAFRAARTLLALDGRTVPPALDWGFWSEAYVARNVRLPWNGEAFDGPIHSLALALADARNRLYDGAPLGDVTPELERVLFS